MIIYLFDPTTLQFLSAVSNPVEFPANSTAIPPTPGAVAPQYFVNGEWTFDNPFTPEVETEYPVIQIQNIQISNMELDAAGIWNGPTDTVLTLTADTFLPTGKFTAIVQKIVNKVAVSDLRFDANIAAGEGQSILTLPLYFKDSGNYLITQERLNEGLAEIKQVFRVAFAPVDLNVVVKIPQS